MIDFKSLVLKKSDYDTWEEYMEYSQQLEYQQNKVIAEKLISGWRNDVPEQVKVWIHWSANYECLLFSVAPRYGVTGYESFGLASLKEGWDKKPEFNRFCMCAGGMGWDSLYLDKGEVFEFLSPRW